MNKLRKISLVLGGLIALFIHTTEAQNLAELDSLKTLLHQSKDTAHINKLIEISKTYAKYRIADSTYHYANQAVEQSKAFKNNVLEAQALNYKGWAFELQKKFPESLDCLNRSVQLWEALKDDKGLSITHNTIGRVYISLRAYEKAQKHFLLSQQLAIKAGDKRGVQIANQNLGLVFHAMKRYKDAIQYRRKTLQYAKESNDKYTEATTLMGMGGSYRSLEMLDSAFYCQERSLKLARELQHNALILAAGMGFTHTSLKMKRFELASQILDGLYPLIDQKNENTLSYYYNYKAEILFGLKKYDQALKLANNNLKTAENLNDHILLNNAYHQLYEFHKKLNNEKEALVYHEEFLTIQDSIYKQEQAEQVQSLEVQHETAQKEAQIANLRQEGKIKALQLRQSNLLLGFLVIGALLSIGLIYSFYRQRLFQAEFNRLQTEQRLLRTQMNPHFFFHALSSIQAFILNEEDKRKSVRYLSKFSKLMRNVLDSSRADMISLEEEIQTLEHYISLQQLRYNQAFQYEIIVDEQIQPQQYTIPPLLLQPIVENAIEHGLVPKKQQGHLDLRFTLAGEALNITICDDGIGRGKKKVMKVHKRKSVALELVKERLQLLTKNKLYKASMEVIDLTDNAGNASGTKVVFHLPLQTAI